MTVKRLYQQVTGDTAAHQRAIDARLKRMPHARQRIVKARAAGKDLRAIAAGEGVTHGTIATVIKRTLKAIAKDLAGLPRYHQVGRKKADPGPPSPAVGT